MKRSALKLFFTALLLSGIAATNPASAGQAQKLASNSITSTVPAAQREAITSAAIRTLRYITQARSAIHKNDLDQARQNVQQARELTTLIEAARQELDRLEASLVFTEFDLPLAACQQQILAAQEALARNQPAAADKNLVAAEESIQFITLGGGAALVGMRAHLSRAAKNYHDEYFAAAKADLAQASEWLRRAGKDGDEKSRKEAQKLAADIDALKDKLDAEADEHTHTLSAFFHRSVALIEREAEDLWLRYKLQQAANNTLRKLLDAKIHLYYGKIDLAQGRGTDSIRKELESTDRYLEEALSQAEPPVSERIKHLREEVRALEQNLDGDRKQVKARYEQTMTNLVQLIHNH